MTNENCFATTTTTTTQTTIRFDLLLHSLAWVSCARESNRIELVPLADLCRRNSNLVADHVPAAQIVDYLAPLVKLGLRSVIVFGVIVKGTSSKDATGSCALSDSSPCAVATRALKAAYGSRLLVATDVCLCGYTSHGHCGVFADADGKVIDQARSASQIALVGSLHAIVVRLVVHTLRHAQHCTTPERAPTLWRRLT